MRNFGDEDEVDFLKFAGSYLSTLPQEKGCRKCDKGLII
jgi:hypothetical protein